MRVCVHVISGGHVAWPPRIRKRKEGRRGGKRVRRETEENNAKMPGPAAKVTRTCSAIKESTFYTRTRYTGRDDCATRTHRRQTKQKKTKKRETRGSSDAPALVTAAGEGENQ